jgi:hypothetical protein
VTNTIPTGGIKKRGRPKGSKNKPKAPTITAPATKGKGKAKKDDEGGHWIIEPGYTNCEGSGDYCAKCVWVPDVPATKGKRKMKEEKTRVREQKKLDGFPKRPKNAYILFMEKIYADCDARGGKKPSPTEVGNLYKALPAEEMATYTEAANELREKFGKAKREFYKANPHYNKSEESVIEV